MTQLAAEWTGCVRDYWLPQHVAASSTCAPLNLHLTPQFHPSSCFFLQRCCCCIGTSHSFFMYVTIVPFKVPPRTVAS